MNQEGVIEIDGKRYLCDEPELEVVYNTDSLGTYVQFSLSGNLALKEVSNEH